MNFKLIGENNLYDPFKTVLKNRQIKDIEGFLNPSWHHVNDPERLLNIDEAFKCLHAHIKNGSEIYIQVDSDTDGWTSAAILIKYLRRVFPDVKISFSLHEGKLHGIDMAAVLESENKYDLVIVPDAGSNEYEKHKTLKDSGIDVIVIDHHEAEKLSEDAIVVNNQFSPDYTNEYFSGAGVVWQFIRYADKQLGLDYANDYLDLVAMGNVADSMSLSSLETRFIAFEGIKNIRNKFFNTLIDKSFGLVRERMKPADISWKLTPIINGMIRVGKQEEKLEMFEALLEKDEQYVNSRTKKQETWQEKAVREGNNARSRQKKDVEKQLGLILGQITEKKMDKNWLLLAETDKTFNRSLSGLLAGKLAEQFQRPALVMCCREEGFFTGSLRGYDRFMPDTKDFLNATGLFEFVEGHQQAAGFRIRKENIPALIEMTNKSMTQFAADVDKVYVDFILDSKQISKDFVSEMCKYDHMWGKGVEEPVYGLQKIEINADDIMMTSKTGSTAKFTYRGLEFIKFNISEQFRDLMESKERLVFDLAVTFGVNEYRGMKTYQCVIKDYELVERKEKKFFF